MTSRPPIPTALDSLADCALGLARVHHAPAADVLIFQVALLCQCLGPFVVFENRESDPGWPFLATVRGPSPPGWFPVLTAPLRRIQAGLGSYSRGVMRRIRKSGAAESAKRAAAHLRGIDPVFESDARRCEMFIELAADPPAWEFLRFPGEDGSTLPRKGAGDGLTVVIDGPEDLGRLRRAGASPRSLLAPLLDPELRPRVLPAGWCDERTATGIARGPTPFRFGTPPLFLPVETGRVFKRGAQEDEWIERESPEDGLVHQMGTLLRVWESTLRRILARRYASMPREFKPGDAILEMLADAEAGLSARRESLSAEARLWSPTLARLPEQILLLVHTMHEGGGSHSHGDAELARTALDLAGMIHERAVRWLEQVLPGPQSGIGDDDVRVLDRLRRFGPLDARLLLRKTPGLKAASRDISLGRLILAGHVRRDESGLLHHVR